MEKFRFIREYVWWNAGFGSLRDIRGFIEDYEPLVEPTIVPVADSTEAKDTNNGHHAMAAETPTNGKHRTSGYYTAADYHALYLSGELTPTAVASTLLSLIAKDGPEKSLHAAAFFDAKPDLVMHAAEASTRRYKAGKPLSVLDGVPTAVKDEYDMEGYRTCLGSGNDYTPPERTAGGDDQDSITSWSVQKLQEAGCIIIGKLHMVEFGLDTPGNNPNFEPLLNPYNTKYYTGGSSSGSGFAVASGLLPFALGSDGGGSIRIPASFCSVFGLKPTHGRISFWPGQNHAISCACLGPLASDIHSLASVFSVIGQPHSSSPFPPVPSVPNLLSPSLTRPKILGIPEVWFDRAEPAVQQLCRSFIDKLADKHGYTKVPISIPFLTEGQSAHALTILADATTLLPEPRGLTWVTRILLALGSCTTAIDYVLAQKLRRLLVRHLAFLWQQYPGLVIVTPTTGCAGWPVRSAREHMWGVSDGDSTIKSMEYVWMANFCGLPSLTVPAGYVVPEGSPGAGQVADVHADGKVPVGMMFMGEWASEAHLLQIGLDAESISDERRSRPPVWVDVVKMAKECQNNGVEGA